MIRGVVEVALARGQNLPMPYMMLVVPLMFESMGFRAIVDRTLAVDCPEYLQLARVKNRSGMEFETVARIMATQVSRALRLQIADEVIFNAADVLALHGQVAALHQRYLALAGSVS